jgi:hypothetical protein
MDNMGGSAPPPPPPPPDGGMGGGAPGMGGGMGGGSFAPMGLGDILSKAFELYRNNAAQLIQIVAIVVVPLSFISALLTNVAFKQNDVTCVQEADFTVNCNGSGFGRAILVLALTGLIAAMIQQLLTGALTRGAAGSLAGRPIDVGESYRYAFSRLGGLLLLAFLIAVVVGVGLILLIIPGLIFSVFLSMATPAFIVERKGATDAMSRSWNLVSGSFWHVLGVVVVAAILAGVVNSVISAIGGGNFVTAWIFNALAQIITAPFVALVAVVLYVDLRARREGLDAAKLAAELDQTRA